MLFSDLPLDARLLRTLGHLGFEHPTEIQQQAIPTAMKGKDLIASSKTGSGKTLAFVLPAIQRMMRNKALSKRDPRALILAPTRELAKQVYTQLKHFLANTQFKAIQVLGGENFNDQAKALAKDPDFIVATPGRLADHLKQNSFALNGLELLILDEADRMLDLGFEPQLREINRQADHRLRQTLMFSATLDDVEVNALAQDLLKSPERIAIGRGSESHSDIQQHFYLCDHLDHKQTLVEALLKQSDINQAIIFTATRKDTERLSQAIAELGYTTASLHGDMKQSARNQIMQSFAAKKQQILVTTDVASRGLDILSVSLVVNFDMPKHAEEYVHRIGRTGRAGAQGKACSVIGPKDWDAFKRVEAFLQTTIKFEEIPGLEAKFKGIFTRNKPNKKTPSKSQKTNKKPVNQSAKKAKPKKGYSLVGKEDIGMMAVKKRKKPMIEDTDS